MHCVECDAFAFASYRLLRPLLLLLCLSQLAWRCHAQTTTLAFTTSIPPNTYNATCGWYTFTYQTWCPSATATYVVPRSSCSLSPAGDAPTSCPPSPAYASVSCANTATCLQTVSAPNSVNLCIVVVNTGTAAVTCDVSITGEGLPLVGKRHRRPGLAPTLTGVWWNPPPTVDWSQGAVPRVAVHYWSCWLLQVLGSAALCRVTRLRPSPERLTLPFSARVPGHACRFDGA